MNVRHQQEMLDILGYYVGDINGIRDTGLVEATKAFQRDNGLDADGIAGPITEKQMRHNITYSLNIPEKPDTLPVQQTPEADWWKTIRYFRREEFRCPCGVCGGFTVEPDRYTVEIADEIREELDAPMIIIPLTGDPHGGGSGVRCQPYNDSLQNSVPNSWHTKGKAFDFVCNGRSATVIEAVLARKQAQGKIRYWYKCGTASWHVDTGGIQ